MAGKCFQIEDVQKDKMHAGSKAPADISCIAGQMGFLPLRLIRSTEKGDWIAKAYYEAFYYAQWTRIRHDVPDSSILLLQIPLYGRELGRAKALTYLKRKKHCRMIAVVHDIMGFRGIASDRPSEMKEYEAMLRMADVLIVHNQRMKEYLIRRGMREEQLIPLQIFDYLSDNAAHDAQFERSVSIAGNLSPEKSPYIEKLAELNLPVHLYGVHYHAVAEEPNIHYHGAFPAEEIPAKLDRGFGLIWDGDSLDSCTGPTGRYLQINNPHKLSLYLTAGLPVVIWDKAAEAEFVQQAGAGIVVSSLRELPDTLQQITPEQYETMAQAARRIQAKVRSGYYTKAALRKALRLIAGGKQVTDSRGAIR